MTTDIYLCCDEGRRAALTAPTAPATLSGTDYIEVHSGVSTLDPVVIDIFLVKPLALPLAQITAAQVVIAGGVRFGAPRPADPVGHFPGAGQVARYRVTLPGGQNTDFSTYTLRLVAGPGLTAPPAFIDPRLAAVDFSFKIDCPSDFDCAPDCAPDSDPAAEEPLFDYTTRDWQGFRRQMLDRMRSHCPREGTRHVGIIDFDVDHGCVSVVGVDIKPPQVGCGHV